MQYEFQFNLQQKDLISAAISFWEKQEVKDKVTEFLECCDEINEFEAKDEWEGLTQEVIEQSNQNMSPPKLKGEWFHIVKEIGEKIYNWYRHVAVDYEFPFVVEGELINYVDEIHWTPHGIVDEVKIFKSYLLKNPDLNNLHIIKMYSIACSYALEEHINDLWQKMSEDVKDYCDSEIDHYHDRHILAYWKYRRDADLSDLMKYFDTVYTIQRDETAEYNFQYNPNYSPEENMFWVSVRKGYSIAVEYFWAKLTEEEKDRSVRGCARMAVMRHNYYENKNESSKSYKKKKYIEICIFLLNQMTINQRKHFFKTQSILDKDFNVVDLEKDVKDELLMMLLSAWPWQEFLILILNDMIGHIIRERETFCMFLHRITTKMVRDHKLGYAVDNSKYQNILQAVWCNMTGSIKRNIICQSLYFIIADLLEVWDLYNLKLIFNDPEITYVRHYYIETGKRGFLKLILNDRYDLLDQFIKEIFRSEEEKRCFKQKINIWTDSPPDKQYYTAEKLFNYQCSCPDEGEYLGGGIDDVGLCEYFVKQNRYDSVDKFLNWKFETEEEKRKCKDHFKDDKFAIVQVYKIWESQGTNLNKAKENSSRFLHWLLESEEEVAQFKKEKIVNSDQGILFVNYFVKHGLIKIMEDFFFECLSSKEEIQQIKQKIAHNMGHFICNHNISLGHANKAKSFVQWAFSEKESMKSFVKEFIVSNDGITSCYGFLKNSNTPTPYTPIVCFESKLEKLSELVDFWIKPLENIHEFRIKFTSYEVNFDDAVQKENHKIFMDFLANLEQNTQ